jgi:hypothetical protein
MKSFANTFRNAKVGNVIGFCSEYHDGRGGSCIAHLRGTVIKINKRTIRLMCAKTDVAYLVDINGTWKRAKVSKRKLAARKLVPYWNNTEFVNPLSWLKKSR